MGRGLFIGIDGGGTHSTAAAAWPDGRVAAYVTGGGLNYHHAGVETVRARMEEMVEALCRRAGAAAEKICVGMSALDGPADEETLVRFVSDRLPRGALDLQSDVYAALMGFTLGEAGLIAVCGTGSMLLLADAEGRQTVSGGWGYLMDDAGSGYALARDALLAAADRADGVGPETRLLPLAMARFGAKSPRGLIDKIYAPECTPDRLAAFAADVLAEAAAGERTAGEILRRNMERLAARAAALMRNAPEVSRVGLYGGVFAHSGLARDLFFGALSSRRPGAVLCPVLFPPEIGAIIHLMRAEGLLNGETLERLKNTCREAAL